ncbi:hypothetical protein CBL_01249 [Carabus blaptoides fortunei]
MLVLAAGVIVFAVSCHLYRPTHDTNLLIPKDSGQSNNANNVIYATANRDLTFTFTDSSEEFIGLVSSVLGKRRFEHVKICEKNMNDEDVFECLDRIFHSGAFGETPQREKTSEDLVHYVTGMLRVGSGGTHEPTAKLTRPKSWHRSLAV